MITELDCRFVQHTIIDSGAADLFRQQLARNSSRGPDAKVDYALLLIGMQLAVRTHRQAHLRRIWRVLTLELPREWQIKWGVIRVKPGEEHDEPLWTLSEADLQNASRAASAAFDYTLRRLRYHIATRRLSPEADLRAIAAQRQQAVEEIVDRIVEATVVPRPQGAEIYAIDASGLHTPELRGQEPKKSSGDGDAGDEDESDTGPEYDELPAEDDLYLEASSSLGSETPGKRRRAPSDSNWGTKTSKSSKQESYKGFAYHTLVRCPDTSRKEGSLSEAPLVDIFRLTEPQVDIVEVSLAMIDTLQARGLRIAELIGDTHYSFKKTKRWLAELTERRISAVLDLRADQVGSYVVDGNLVIGGWVHCPGLPDDLLNLTRPSPSTKVEDDEQANYPGKDPSTVKLTKFQRKLKEFTDKIARREKYAAQRLNPLDKDGQTRWQCPGRAGKVGCSLVTGSVQVAQSLGLEIVAKPPSPESAPSLCTQGSISINAFEDANTVAMKPYQKYYWGSLKWLRHWNRRTYVEGWFGTLKGDSTAGKRRGSSLYNSLPMVYFEAACFTAQTNDIQLTSFHKKNGGDPNEHPLLGRVQDTHTVIRVTTAELEFIQELRRQESTQAAHATEAAAS